MGVHGKDRMDSTVEHYTGVAGERYFARQRRLGEAGYRIEARKFAPHIRPTDSVLDFGCGSGAMVQALECARRLGVEINPAARARAAAAGVEVVPGLAAVPTGSVDVVVSNHALEHVPAPLSVCVEFLRVLRPGGRVVVCVPFDDWRRQRSHRADDANHHLYTWTPLLLGNLLSDAGLEVLGCAVLSQAWPPGWRWLDAHVPPRAFALLCAAWAHLSLQHQVLGLARRSLEGVARET